MEATKTGGEQLPPKGRKALPAIVECYGGRNVVINKFQPHQVIEAGEAAHKNRTKGKPTQIEVSHQLICKIAQFEDGTEVTMEAIRRMYKSDVDEILGYVQPPLKVLKKEPSKEFGQIQSGTLPSGASFELRFANGGDTIDAERAYGPENTAYMLISICCKINGENPQMQDVQIMDGQDFMALLDRINEVPS